jgi:endogenous inhibitor of DNA gyrase (YacG/DUF329 family)
VSSFKCPKCGSANVRPSFKRNWVERALAAFGVEQVRCRECDERFTRGIVDLRNAIYARCPRCYRLELWSWKRDHYHIPFLSRVLLSVGGKPRRCDACRCNFVSFRPVKVQPVRRAKQPPAVTGGELINP